MAKSWDNVNYTKRRTITLDNPTGALSDATVPLILEDAAAIANAEMISKRYQIYDSAGVELSYDEEFYVEGASYPNAIIHIKMPDLYVSPSGDQNKVFLYYDYDPGSDQDDTNGAYRSTCKLCLHMEGANAAAINDRTINGNDVAGDNGTPTYQATGQLGYGYCVDFDAQADCLYVNDDTTIKPTEAITIECWVKSSGLTSNDRFICKHRGGTSSTYQIYMPGSASVTYATFFKVSTGSGQTNNMGNVGGGSWHHLCATYDNATDDHLGYGDGSGVGGESESGSLSYTTDEFVIGALDAVGGDGVIANIDEVRIWSEALAAEEIAYTYHMRSEADFGQLWGAQEDFDENSSSSSPSSDSSGDRTSSSSSSTTVTSSSSSSSTTVTSSSSSSTTQTSSSSSSSTTVTSSSSSSSTTVTSSSSSSTTQTSSSSSSSTTVTSSSSSTTVTSSSSSSTTQTSSSSSSTSVTSSSSSTSVTSSSSSTTVTSSSSSTTVTSSSSSTTVTSSSSSTTVTSSSSSSTTQTSSTSSSSTTVTSSSSSSTTQTSSTSSSSTTATSSSSTTATSSSSTTATSSSSTTATSSSSSSSSSGLTLKESGKVWNECNINLAKSMAYFDNKKQTLFEAYASIVLSTDIATEVDLLYQFVDLHDANDEGVKRSVFRQPVEALAEFAQNSFFEEYLLTYTLTPEQIRAANGKITLDQFLTMKGFKISRSFLEVLQYKTTFDENNDNRDQQTDVTSYVSQENLLIEGEWKYESIVSNAGLGAEYQFLLEVYSDSDYSNLIYSLNTSESQRGWYYEVAQDDEDNKIYEDFPAEGITSEYIGRTVRYISTPDIIDTGVLGRGTVYYTKFYKITDGTTGTVTESSDIIYT